MALLFTLHHRNKENQPPPRLRDTSRNPYSKTYVKPIEKDPHSTAAPPASRSAIAPPVSRPARSSLKPVAKAPSASLIITIEEEEEEEETSPTIRRILEKTGCSSRQELLAMRAAQEKVNTSNGSKSINTNTNTNGSTNPSNKGSKSKAVPNGSKTTTNGSKATNGTKSTTNPKKKAKSK